MPLVQCSLVQAALILLSHATRNATQIKRPAKIAGLRVRPIGIEPTQLAPEASALSTELRALKVINSILDYNSFVKPFLKNLYIFLLKSV